MSNKKSSDKGQTQPTQKAQSGKLKPASIFPSEDNEPNKAPIEEQDKKMDEHLSESSIPDNSESDNFASDIDDAFDSNLDGIFQEEDLFDADARAPLEELGIANPANGNVTSSNLFRGGIPRSLQAPPCRPGYTQKFIQYLTPSGERKERNISTSRRLGWIPRKIEPGEFSLPTRKIGSSSIIMIDGLVLCEMPLERQEAIQDARQADTHRQTSAVESKFKDEGSNSHVPVTYEADARVKRGTKIPKVASDKD